MGTIITVETPSKCFIHINILIYPEEEAYRPVMSIAFSEAKFSVLPRSPACPPAPKAAISSMSDRRPALCDLQMRERKCRHLSTSCLISSSLDKLNVAFFPVSNRMKSVKMQ